MVHKKDKEKGVTLIELLMVLVILSTILLISFPIFQRSVHSNDVPLFFEQLEKDLYESQMKAINDGITVRFLFSVTNKNYIIRHNTVIVHERPFPSGMRVSNGSLKLGDLRFLPSGNVSYSGTVLFYVEDNLYVLVIQFSRGRFYIDKF